MSTTTEQPLVGRMFQGVDKKSAAFRLMKSMGWEEGSGLGKNKQGITTHVRVSKKHDSAGLGINEAKKGASEWTVNTAVFDNILKNLQVHATSNKNIQKDSNSSDSSSSESDESDSESGYDSDSEAESSHGSEDDEGPSKKIEPVVPVSKLARPQGRYKRREAGKEVSLYSQTDLSAILGHAPGTPAAASVQVPKANGEKTAKTPKPKPATASASPVSYPAAPLPKLPADWWGRQYGFVRAGELGASGEARADPLTAGKFLKENGKDNAMPSGFSEQDQENLYKLVQDHATTGKRGLGIADAPKKVAGARWKGSKVTFGDDEGNEPESGDGDDGSAVLSPQSDSEKEKRGNKRKLKDSMVAVADKESKKTGKKMKLEDGKAATAIDSTGKQHVAVKSSKWRKLITTVVKEKGGLDGLSVKEVRTHVISQIRSLPGTNRIDKLTLRSTFLEQLNKSKDIVVHGNLVKLRV